MKKCPACDHVFPSEFHACPCCGNQPSVIDGFIAFTPQLSDGETGFKPGYFANLARLEAGNFWFRARNELILWFLRAYRINTQCFLEIGCGTGFVISEVARHFPNSDLYGSEIFFEGLKFAARRVKNAVFTQMDAREIPFREEFDVIGAFDVLEHIDHDERVITEVHAALKPGGHFLLTVPQHRWLWSGLDDYACHQRRYDSLEIHAKLTAGGFNIVRSSSFMTLLLPAMYISRLFGTRGQVSEAEAEREFGLPNWLNETLYKVVSLERFAIRAGLDFPIGGSRIVLARKI